MASAGVAAVAAAVPGIAAAAEPGRADYATSADLVAAGAEPFAVSGVGNAIYGLRRDRDLYLCFIADTPQAQSERQQKLLAEIAGGATDDRSVPSIPVLCVMTQ